MGRQHSFRLWVLVGIIFIPIAPLYGQGLVGPSVNPADFGVGRLRQHTDAARLRYAKVNLDVLRASEIPVDLFPDVSVTIVNRTRESQYAAETWSGEVLDHPFSSAVLAVSDDVLFGKIELDGRTFLIRQEEGPVYSILETSSRLKPDEGPNDGVPLPEGELGARLGKGEAASVCLASSACSGKVIDVMVVYTQQARVALGGSSASANAAIAAAVAEMNAANSNSGVTHTVRLVYTAEVAYAESGNAGTDLSRLGGTSDGYMDVIHSWRNAYGADLVSLITDTGGCGLGYTQSDPSSYSSAAAFSVVRNDCLTGNKSLAHEMGHNMGLHHDWYVNTNTAPCPWHHGYVNQAAFGGSPAQRWRTVMAYNGQCSDQGGFTCTRITYWSNPQRSYNGDPMGVPQSQSNPSDAVFTLNRAACQVADFRASASPTVPPSAPTNLTATGISESVIDVSWQDNASDETGYKVQRSSDGVSAWSDIATLAANSETFSDGGLTQGSTFYYRTYAVRNGDRSGYSNADSALTRVSFTDYAVTGESVRYGSSSGDYTDLSADDGVFETLEEEETAGWIQSRTSRLEVTWRFDVPSGSPLTFHVNAWVSVSRDEDAFMMSYSMDSTAFSPMFELSDTLDTGDYRTFDIGVPTGTAVWIRLEDTNRVRGNLMTDRVLVDHMYLRSEGTTVSPPPVAAAPSIHLGDLSMSTAGRNRWTSSVVAAVHNLEHEPEPDVIVSGVWSEGDPGSCETDASGTCEIGRAWKPKVKAVTFTVVSLWKPEMVYDETLNDVDVSVVGMSLYTVSKKDEIEGLPERLTLRQNYPNPFNPSTVLEYGLPEAGPVRVSIYNALGMEVRRLRDEVMEAGWHQVTFDGTDLSSGVYVAIVQTPGATQSRTMLLTK